MEKIIFDNGIKEFEVNGTGVLRFNPGDPNVYARFMEAAEKIQTVEKDMESRGKELAADDGAGVLRLLADADKQVKELLNRVFGKGNDFDEITGGVNLMAVAINGERVITNLLQALMPIVEKGANDCAEQQIGDAVKRAEANRAQRGARP